MYTPACLVFISTKLTSRYQTVTCRPTLVDDKKPKPKNFLVSTRTARSEAEKAKFPERTKSGDPHRYFNGDGLVFGKPHCDTDAELWEYPVFWTAVKKTWNMNELTRNQPATPIRVVYAKVGGEVQYCGVMTHSQVDKDNRGKAFFQLCT